MTTAPCFYVKDGNQVVGQIDLNSFPFVIGRARECDYVIDAHDISRQHAQLTFDHQQVILRDLGSTNGTFLNEDRIIPNRNYRLRANDVVRFATSTPLIFDDPSTTAQLNVEDAINEGLRLDDATAHAYVRGQLVEPPLSPSQILLLQLIICNEGIVVSRDDIRQHVWGGDQRVTDQAIDALISRLRKRLAEIDPDHEYLITRRGFGLVFRNRRLSLANS